MPLLSTKLSKQPNKNPPALHSRLSTLLPFTSRYTLMAVSMLRPMEVARVDRSSSFVTKTTNAALFHGVPPNSAALCTLHWPQKPYQCVMGLILPCFCHNSLVTSSIQPIFLTLSASLVLLTVSLNSKLLVPPNRSRTNASA